jgi:aryl-alcohol dehydrogenase-like predicted oxidoreductase
VGFLCWSPLKGGWLTGKSNPPPYWTPLRAHACLSVTFRLLVVERKIMERFSDLIMERFSDLIMESFGDLIMERFSDL